MFDWGMALGSFRKKNSEGRSLLGENVYRFKYQDDEKCGKILASLIQMFLESDRIPLKIDVSTSVPVTLQSRTFWPMKYIIEHADSDLISPFIPDLLVRKKITVQAKDMSDVEEKRKRMKGVFAVNASNDITGKSVLLFDDIYDTGATLDECSRVLKDAGASAVLALVLVVTRPGL